MKDFWNSFSFPVFALAPMEDVTDTVFRELLLSIASPGKLHLLFTEFTSVEGLCHPRGRQAVIHRLHVNDSEHDLLKQTGVKLIAQIWGVNPEKYFKAARFIAENYSFDGIDLNMGCPVDKIVKQGACSALIGQNALVNEIVEATREGSKLPVSIKTRTGIKSHQTEGWMAHLLTLNISAITLHARTQKMMSLKPAEWNQIALAVKLRNEINPEIKILGNGDIESYAHGLQRIEETDADGIMVGRGIFSNPWFFTDNDFMPETDEKLNLLEKHIHLYTQTWGTHRNFNILKRFFKIYVSGFEGAAALRADLMQCNNEEQAMGAIYNFRNLGGK
ncbi:MAG: tRNA-dihydrouridine synthase [Lentimicrobiaceae bacterium]|nr:tRNA-dihydrouridine synthase [Lentimicrobiaceae bacterium]